MLSFAATVLLDGVSYGMVLFLISVGLTITMGLMRVVNLAHGSFAMIGGYTAGYLTQKGVNFYLAIVGAAVVAGALGGLAELTVYRPLYRKGELSQVLLTIGIVFVATAIATEMFGALRSTGTSPTANACVKLKHLYPSCAGMAFNPTIASKAPARNN